MSASLGSGTSSALLAHQAQVYIDQMVLLLLLVGLLIAAWPTPIVRVTGHHAAASTRTIRGVGLGIALLALTTALVIGP